MKISARYEFRCTNCGKRIPWELTKSDVGIAEWEQPSAGGLYPYEKCWCGWGKFVRCTDCESAGAPEDEETAEAEIRRKTDEARYEKLPLGQIHPNPRQPRKFFDKEALQSLADSISTVGLLEDILVRPDTENGGYEIVLGERRWRASQLAGRDTISSKVVDLTDAEAKLISIVENVQRENLTDVEEAFSFKSYVDGGMSVQEVGRSLGKLGERVAGKLKTLSSHYYIKFQEERVKELTTDNENLRSKISALQSSNNGSFAARVISSKHDLTSLISDGWEFVVELSDGDFVVRKPNVKGERP